MPLNKTIAGCLVAVVLAGSASWADTDMDMPPGAPPMAGKIKAPKFEDAAKVGRLIDQLGSARYVARQEAEQQLMEIGLKAFDQIDASTQHSDPEISASCRYLISELTVRWTRRDDVPQVKSELVGYADYDDDQRMSVVSTLGQQHEDWAISPLCRICRYDRSPSISRQAALALLANSKFDLGYSAEVADQLRKEIGTSVRPSAMWVRVLAAQIEDPRVALAAWPAEIEKAVTAAAADPEDQMYQFQVAQLLRNYARVGLECNDSEVFHAAVDRFMEFAPTGDVAALKHFIDWAIEAKAEQLVVQLIDRHRDTLSESKAGLYLIAATYGKQGNKELAEQFANKAFELSGEHKEEGSPESRSVAGAGLLKEGYLDWGRRELRKAMEEAPVASDIHARAAWVLSDSLHDWEEYRKAADVLATVTKPLEEDTNLRKEYEDRARNATRMGLSTTTLSIKRLDSQQSYYEARALIEEGDTDAAWKALDRAWKLDDDNVDIVITMYRASSDDAKHRKEVMELIHQRCRMLEQRIDEYAGTSPYVNAWYNEWAWLISNTEGDFQKAIRFSHKSIELQKQMIEMEPELSEDSIAGLLDTLGRCYFAAGDLDSAIKYQSQAVESRPHMRTLQRQLEEFQQAKAEQQG